MSSFCLRCVNEFEGGPLDVLCGWCEAEPQPLRLLVRAACDSCDCPPAAGSEVYYRGNGCFMCAPCIEFSEDT